MFTITVAVVVGSLAPWGFCLKKASDGNNEVFSLISNSVYNEKLRTIFVEVEIIEAIDANFVCTKGKREKKSRLLKMTNNESLYYIIFPSHASR